MSLSKCIVLYCLFVGLSFVPVFEVFESYPMLNIVWILGCMTGIVFITFLAYFAMEKSSQDSLREQGETE